jgi:hypothetical protein
MHHSTLYHLATDAAAQGAVTMLLETYRAHPEIVRMYQRPYDGRLIVRTDPRHLSNVAKRVLPTRCPVMLCHVEGREEQERDSPSWMNRPEAEACMEFVQRLLSAGAAFDDIIVLCPYAKQCEHLRHLLHGRFRKGHAPFVPPPNWDQRQPIVRVATVEVYQGREARFVLLSCVRSAHVREIEGVDRKFNIGFTSNPERANVALSRARDGLVVVGNFTTLATSAVWRGAVEDALAINAVWHHAEKRVMQPADFAKVMEAADPAAAAAAAATVTFGPSLSAVDAAAVADSGFDEAMIRRDE